MNSSHYKRLTKYFGFVFITVYSLASIVDHFVVAISLIFVGPALITLGYAITAEEQTIYYQKTFFVPMIYFGISLLTLIAFPIVVNILPEASSIRAIILLFVYSLVGGPQDPIVLVIRIAILAVFIPLLCYFYIHYVRSAHKELREDGYLAKDAKILKQKSTGPIFGIEGLEYDDASKK